jgi:hypothetical protein
MDEHVETDEMFQNAGKKGDRHLETRKIRPGGVPTTEEATGPTTMIGHR